MSVQVSSDDTDIGRWERLSGNFAGLLPRSLSSVSLSSVHTEKEAKKRKAQVEYIYIADVIGASLSEPRTSRNRVCTVCIHGWTVLP